MEIAAITTTNKRLNQNSNDVALLSENKESASKSIRKDELKKADMSQSEPVLNEQQATTLANSVNAFLDSIQTDLHVKIHKETNTAVFTIVRREDQKVIREVPAREMLEIKSRIEKMEGSFLNEKA
ncbi:MAG: flagellar protein FlaG [Pseudomonadota bacterium]